MTDSQLLKLYYFPLCELELAPPLSPEHWLLMSVILDQFQQFRSANITNTYRETNLHIITTIFLHFILLVKKNASVGYVLTSIHQVVIIYT